MYVPVYCTGCTDACVCVVGRPCRAALLAVPSDNTDASVWLCVLKNTLVIQPLQGSNMGCLLALTFDTHHGATCQRGLSQPLHENCSVAPLNSSAVKKFQPSLHLQMIIAFAAIGIL